MGATLFRSRRSISSSWRKHLHYGHVVRLKGGDPFVFGRAQEELEAAAAAGIPTEVIPGISSAIAVPASQMIPLTCRGISESFWVTTGTTRSGDISADIALAARSTATVVILMAMSKLANIMDIFIEAGKAETPVAIIQDGTTHKEKMIIGKAIGYQLPRNACRHRQPCSDRSRRSGEAPGQSRYIILFVHPDFFLTAGKFNIAQTSRRMKELKKQCDPASCLLCRSVQQAWLPAIEANRKIFQLKKGETLFKEGDPMPGMYFIHQGLIKVHKHWDEEKELILRFAKGGDIVGHRGLGIDNIYPVTATVLETTEVCYVDNDFFQATLKMNPDFLYQLMLFFAAELKESERRMRNLAHMPVKGRIAQALTRLQEKFGKDDAGFIALPVSRQDFASYIGATYETTFRLMNEMEAEGLIRWKEKRRPSCNHSPEFTTAKFLQDHHSIQ